MRQQCEFAKQAQDPDRGPKLDLGFKEGQTIKLNIAVSPASLTAGRGRAVLVLVAATPAAVPSPAQPITCCLPAGRVYGAGSPVPGGPLG